MFIGNNNYIYEAQTVERRSKYVVRRYLVLYYYCIAALHNISYGNTFPEIPYFTNTIY